jgi:hypothetical protein
LQDVRPDALWPEFERYTKENKSMSNMKTKSEEAFEKFLNDNGLEFEKIEEDDSPRPDYLVKIDTCKIVFELKELAEDKNFKTEQFSLSKRIIGDHVRKKIHVAKKQIQFAAKQGLPSVLLIYNNLDPFHSFGTEDMDFISAMYGEYTLVFDKTHGKISDSFHGLNQSLAAAKNTSFSAVGRLSPYLAIMKVTLFENTFSKIKIQYDKLPTCFDVVKFQIETV